MIAAALPQNEHARLEALRRTGLLDSPPDKAFEDFAKLAAFICKTPIALVSLVDEDRQWFKAKVGLGVPATARTDSFCAHAILEREVMTVPDALDDARFVDNPLVVGPPKIRFYAGAPLVTPEGHALGTLCVIDREPRKLEPAQIEALDALARQVVNYIELRMREGLLDRSTQELHKTQRESRTASRAVQSLLNLQRAIFDGASHAIIACAPDGTVLSFNRAAARMLGYDAAEVVGKITWVQFHDPAEVAARARELSAELHEPVAPGMDAFTAKARRNVPDEREWTWARQDGSRFPVLLAVTALREQTGALTGFVALAQDITERKQVEQIKNEFVSIVSHELRTPLTSIRGALGLLEGGVLGELPEQAREMITIARTNSDRLIRLINEILDLEKIEAGKIELAVSQVDAEELVRAALEGIAGFAAEASIELRAQVAERAALVGDRDRLLQVLTNLLSNAIKFSPPQGVVSVRVETRGANLRFSIADSGPGIPEHQRSLLFRKFQQLDSSDTRRKGGTGLGLAITKAIVEQHRGRIWVESEPGKGAVFLFEIPRRAAASHTSPAGLVAQVRRRVLVIEDDPDLRAVVLQTLVSAGFQAQAAASLAGARALLAQSKPDAILLDIGLPDGTGLELLEELRASPDTADIPVLVTSGKAIEETGLTSAQVTRPLVVDWLQKPFQQEALVGALRRALPGGKTPQVLVVDDDDVSRATLTGILAALGVETLQARDVPAAAVLLRDKSPDLVLFGMAEAGAELLPELARHQRETSRVTPLLLYAGRELTAGDRRRVTAALARSLPREGASPEEFLRAVRQVLAELQPGRPA